MSTSPKKPYQSQIDALSKRLDPQDEWFGEIEFKLDHLIQASEKSLMQGPPKPLHTLQQTLRSGVMIIINGSCISHANKRNLSRRNPSRSFTLAFSTESREVVGDMVKGILQDRRIATPRDDRRSDNYTEPWNVDPETDRKNVYEGYFDITRKVKIDVPFFWWKDRCRRFFWLVGCYGGLHWSRHRLRAPQPRHRLRAPLSLLQYKPFEKLENSNRFYLTVLTREACANHITFPNSLSSDPPSQGHPAEIVHLLGKFVDIVPEKRPPLRDIQHAIELVHRC